MYEQRKLLYKELENIRKRPLIVYVTSQRENVSANITSDVVNEFIDQVENLPAGTTEVDLFLESLGGDPLVALRIVTFLRSKVNKFSVLIPHSAFSTATLLSLGADEIVMGKYGSLGPIDPQITLEQKGGFQKRFAYEDIISYVNFIKNDFGITEQEHLINAYSSLINNVEPSSIGFSKRSSQLSVNIAEILLKTHMKDSDEKISARLIAEKLNKSFFNHSYALTRMYAKELGLKVVYPGEDLENIIWSIHKDFELELENRKPLDLLSYFLSRSEPFENAVEMNFQDACELEIKLALLESLRISAKSFLKSKLFCYKDALQNLNMKSVIIDSGWMNY